MGLKFLIGFGLVLMGESGLFFGSSSGTKSGGLLSATISGLSGSRSGSLFG